MRRLFCLLAALTILISPLQHQAQSKSSIDKIRSKIEKQKCGKYMRLTLMTGEKVKGRFLPYTYDSKVGSRKYYGDQFTFIVSLKPHNEYKVLSYTEVKEVKVGRSLKEVTVIAGAGVAIIPFLPLLLPLAILMTDPGAAKPCL